MIYIGLDLHSKTSFFYLVDGKGQRIKSCEVPTTKEAIERVVSPHIQDGVRVALEAGGNSYWVSRHLELMGVDVHIVHAKEVKLIVQSKKKTDKVDAKKLAELLRLDGLPRRVHLVSEDNYKTRVQLTARRQLLGQRTAGINMVRGVLRGMGISIKAKGLNSIKGWEILLADPRIKEVKEIACIAQESFGVYKSLTEAINGLNKSINSIQEENRIEEISLLKSIPGIGNVGAHTLMSSIDQVSRFKNAKQLAAYTGLVPSTHNSGETEQSGRITREGRSEIRRVLVQGAHAVLKSQQSQSQPLKEWYCLIEKRRGKKKALVALARKLVCLSYYVLKDKRNYDPRLLEHKQAA